MRVTPDEAVTQEMPARPNIWRRMFVLFEVLLLSLLLPGARMGFKHLAPEGVVRLAILQMGPGVIIVAPALCVFLLLCRKDFKAYGITLGNWPDGLKIGVLLSLLCAGAVVMAAPIFKLAGVNHFTGYEVRGRLLALCFAIPGLALFVWIMRVSQSALRRIPTILACFVLVGLWITPLALAGYFAQPFGASPTTFAGAVFVAGLGEEFVFRGYIQSRLNEFWGRPFCVGGVQFGWGLFIAAFLFGFVHTFNGVDFLDGHLDFQWTWGVSAFFSGCIFGYLREKTGSILAGAIFHGNNDAWTLIVLNLK